MKVFHLVSCIPQNETIVLAGDMSAMCILLQLPSVLWHCWLGVKKSIWVMGYWHGYLSGVWCKWFAYGTADATATPSSLASVKSRMVYLSGAGLPRLSWKKGC